jgi:glutamate-1-semialdehyde 2,1-aminomutase
MKTAQSQALFARARERIPGGVNSPVRAWRAVGGTPLFITQAQGAYLWDSDGNRFIDYVGAYGPTIAGHAHPRVVQALVEQAARGLSFGAPTLPETLLAEEIAAAIPVARKVRLLSSGTEAGMTALRLARAFTGRARIIKFDGCYHGHSDSLLVRAGSGGLTLGVPNSAGVPPELAALTLVAGYNDLASVQSLLDAYPGEVAAIIVEPVAANMGVVAPAPDFLPGLSELAHRHGALLICDEVITGFRLRFGAAYERYRAQPDLVMLGKIIGGGNPIGAVAGRAEIMDLLAPEGPVYQAGTLSGSTLSVRAGLETLAILQEPGVYERLELAGQELENGLNEAMREAAVAGCVNRVGSLLTVFFGISLASNATQATAASSAAYARFFTAMLEQGVYLPPSQFEAWFVSLAHSDQDVTDTLAAARRALKRIGR